MGLQNDNLVCDFGAVRVMGTHANEVRETEAELKARHKMELAVLKDKEAQKIKDEIDRKESVIFDVIEKDEVLLNINFAIKSMEASQFTPDTKPLKKAYNNRLEEISRVMMKLEK